MNRFAALLDRLAYEPRRLGKLELLKAYFRDTPDPDRGWALAAMTGELSFKHLKPAMIRDLVASRTDPVLFGLSYDFVGDLAETVALVWDAPPSRANADLTLTDIVEGVETTPKAQLPAKIAEWLDRLDENGRWALLKLVTGALRIGVSARLARQALARVGARSVEEIEDAWHASAPPYGDLFAWIEERGPKPESDDAARFHPPMLSHAWEERDAALDPADFAAEWKWDGIRVQAAAGHTRSGAHVARLYSRTGDDISKSFPDLIDALHFDAVLDGELLIRRDGRVQSFNTLQQRLNRKGVTAKTIADYPAFICVYDILSLNGRDLRPLSFRERRAMLEAFVADHPDAPIGISPLVDFSSWSDLEAARADPADVVGDDAFDAVEGVMIKRWDSPYLAGRPKGYWWKWKRDPLVVDAVLMYAQRGHGKRSSFYSDYTFGVWKNDPPELVPVGKAYFGFTDEELAKIDRFVRSHTKSRFGPVREVTHDPDKGLVFEVAFEGLQRSTRHKSGVAMRFPRISRIRWDKAPRDADRLESLEALLPLEAAR
ncbi:MAG: cisplatin damage response ATP-dependent DNA ligase [Caulobacterales bacterium]